MGRQTNIPADSGWIAQGIILLAFLLVYVVVRCIGAIVARVTP